MDAMTYIVVVGWVLIYFMPGHRAALATGGAVAGLAVAAEVLRRGEPFPAGGAMEFFLVAFALALLALPMRSAVRRLREWWDGKTAGV